MQKNHLSGLKRRLLKLVFWNETHMAEVRRDCQALVRRNRYKAGSGTAAYDVAAGERGTRERIQARSGSQSLIHTYLTTVDPHHSPHADPDPCGEAPRASAADHLAAALVG